jgi:hypothetical protein
MNDCECGPVFERPAVRILGPHDSVGQHGEPGVDCVV